MSLFFTALLFCISILQSAESIYFDPPKYQPQNILDGQDGWVFNPNGKLSRAADFGLQKSSENQASSFLRAHTVKFTEYSRRIIPVSGIVEFKWRWKAPEDKASLCIGPSDSLIPGQSNWGAFRAKICFDSIDYGLHPHHAKCGKQHLNGNGHAWKIWNYMRLRMDLTGGHYSVYRDMNATRDDEDTLVLNRELAGTGPLSRLFIKAGKSPPYVDMDDIEIDLIGAPPPRPPLVLMITSPSRDTLINKSALIVQYKVDSISLSKTVALVEGLNSIVIDTVDNYGRRAADTIQVSMDSTPPQVLGNSSPVDGTEGWYRNFATVSFVCSDETRLVFCSDPISVTAEGRNIPAIGLARDSAGNTNTATVFINRDAMSPNISLLASSQIPMHSSAQVTLSLTALDSLSGLKSLICNGDTVPIDTAPQTFQAVFDAGSQTITCSAMDSAGNGMSRNFAIEAIPNRVPSAYPDEYSVNAADSLSIPAPGMLANDVDSPIDTLRAVMVRPPTHGSVTFNADGSLGYRPAKGFYGVDSLAYRVTDGIDTSVVAWVVITVVHVPMVLTIASPANGFLTNQPTVDIHYTVNGISFTVRRDLLEGLNSLTVDTLDALGQLLSDTVVVLKDGIPPVVQFQSPVDGFITNQNPIAVAWTVDGTPQTTALLQNLSQGQNSITRSASDAAGNVGTASITVTLLPPETTETGIHALAHANPTNGGVPLKVLFTGKGWADTGVVAYHKWDFNGDGIFDTIMPAVPDTVMLRQFNFASGDEGFVFEGGDPGVSIVGLGNNGLESDTSSYSYPNFVDAHTTSPKIGLPTGTGLRLSYHQYLNVADSGDGGVVEVSRSGGPFTPIEPIGGYTRVIAEHGRGFTGALGVTNPVFDLSSFAGDSVEIRFHFYSDASGSGRGWIIDSLRVFQAVGFENGVSQVSHTYGTQGTHYAVFAVSDSTGNEKRADIRPTIITVGPPGSKVVSIVSPVQDALLNSLKSPVTWKVGDAFQIFDTSETFATEGVNVISRSFTDSTGYTATATITVTVDTSKPAIAILYPVDGFLTNLSELPVVWTVDGVVQDTANLETLYQEGQNTIIRTFTDSAGNTSSTSRMVRRDTEPPNVEITSPRQYSYTYTREPNFIVTWNLDGVPQPSETAVLTEGWNFIERSSTDSAGNTGNSWTYLNLDTQVPRVEILDPEDGFATNQADITVTWSLDGWYWNIDSEHLAVEGANVIVRFNSDEAGNVGADTITVYRDTQRPAVAILEPREGQGFNTPVINVHWTVDGVMQNQGNTETLLPGTNVIRRLSMDAAGNADSIMVTVFLDTTAPIVQIVSPRKGSVVHDSVIPVIWKVDGVIQALYTEEHLVVGQNIIIREYSDSLGNLGADTAIVTYTTDPPVVQILSPANGETIYSTPINVIWAINGAIQDTLTVESLNEGVNIISREAFGAGGNTQREEVSIWVNLDSQVEFCQP